MLEKDYIGQKYAWFPKNMKDAFPNIVSHTFPEATSTFSVAWPEKYCRRKYESYLHDEDAT